MQIIDTSISICKYKSFANEIVMFISEGAKCLIIF